jgi:O-antigen ligase
LTAVLAPGTWKTLEQRVQIGAATSDPSVEWRKEATHVIWQQVRSSPFVGVGFGKGGEFDLNGTHYTITQDPHDSFVLLAAGGGALLVTLFVAMIALFLRDAVRRRRVGTPTERVLVVWSVGVAVSYLLNAFAGPLLSTPGELLIIWSAFLLPMVTTRPAPAEAPVERAPAQRSPLATARRGSARPGAAATAPR